MARAGPARSATLSAARPPETLPAIAPYNEAMPTRRDLLALLGAVPASALSTALPLLSHSQQSFHHRLLGRTGRWVTPLGLGGQGSLQWTPPGIDPAEIIVRAVSLGVNYLDTANAYGPSQANYGRAFERLRLVPGQPGYNAALRDRLFLNTKTKARFSRNPAAPDAPTAVAELKRSLSVIFGDGKGSIPDGAYLDSVQIHNLTTLDEVGQVYEGYAERGGRMPERIGALAGLLDCRDGTNYTGLNPEHRHYVRHLGVTGHKSSAVLMNALRRDAGNVLDTLLVALNANDRRRCAHQNNVLPVAVAKGMGVIAMKAFADGAIYGKPARWSRQPDDVILSVGKPGRINPASLVRYPVSLPGVACLITGIGRVNAGDPADDQLAVNLAAALGDLATEEDRLRIEMELASHSETDTNYFQDPSAGLVQPSEVRVEKDGDRIRVHWSAALAGAEPIRSYFIVAGERPLLSLPCRPQTTLDPLWATVPAAEAGEAPISVVASILPPRPLK